MAIRTRFPSRGKNLVSEDRGKERRDVRLGFGGSALVACTSDRTRGLELCSLALERNEVVLLIIELLVQDLDYINSSVRLPSDEEVKGRTLMKLVLPRSTPRSVQLVKDVVGDDGGMTESLEVARSVQSRLVRAERYLRHGRVTRRVVGGSLVEERSLVLS